MEPNKLILKFKQECDVIVNQYKRKVRTKAEAEIALDAIEQVFSSFVYDFDMNDAFESKEPTQKQKKKYSSYENESIQLMRILYIEGYKEVPIFNDDYGQCFAALINNELIGLGTFNLNICPEVYHLILSDLRQIVMKE